MSGKCVSMEISQMNQVIAAMPEKYPGEWVRGACLNCLANSGVIVPVKCMDNPLNYTDAEDYYNCANCGDVSGAGLRNAMLGLMAQLKNYAEKLISDLDSK